MKWLKFFIIISTYFLFSILDILFTYIGTPDLKYEANPFVLFVHNNWGYGWQFLEPILSRVFWFFPKPVDNQTRK